MAGQNGIPLAEVVVTIRGERGEAVYTTEENGYYRFGLLPPATYTVIAELEGFIPASVEVKITAGSTILAPVLELGLSTSETVTVTADPIAR